MCDSLGQSDQKVKVFKLKLMGQTIVFTNRDDLVEAIKDEMEFIDLGDTSEFEIECSEMYEHEIDNLPEFEGY